MKLYLLGGFLGSGKTTAIQRACEALLNRGNSVAVITNDQGIQLVDSAFIKGHQIPGREVVKGCFCCNYNQLEEGILSLQAEEKLDILFAESVGSCADIVATIIKPLRKFHRETDIVYSVFADALQLLRIAAGKALTFDEDVNYIYEKQLEEADILVVNKSDLLSKEEKCIIENWVQKSFPGRTYLFQNSLEVKDIKKWMETLICFNPDTERNSLQINYDKYGAGEAKLAWLDCEVEISTGNMNAISVATILINKIYSRICQQRLPIGHLKFLMRAGEWQRKVSFTSLNEPFLRQSDSLYNINSLTLIINARVQTLPEILKNTVKEIFDEIMEEQACVIKYHDLSAFQPGFPKPTYRMTDL